MEQLALYIHWPWCKKKCPYCDFNSHVDNMAETDDYVDALITDMQWQASQISQRELISIFFGGGTPSLMRPDQVSRILRETINCFTWADDIEITLEANPTSSSYTLFNNLKDTGINRISIGVQSLQRDLLKFLGREHSVTDAIDTIGHATSIFHNVNVDFIYGIKDQDLNNWIQDISTISKLKTKHVSAYQLTIEPHTKFYSEVNKGKWAPLDDDQQAAFYQASIATLHQYGLEQYEISNFAIPGYACKHNRHIWRYGNYLGIGAGAHGRLTTTAGKHLATYNYKMPQKYIATVKNVKSPYFNTLVLSSRDQAIEALLSGLRLASGVQINEHLMAFIDRSQLQQLINQNYLQQKGSNIAATKQGLLQLDSILLRLIRTI